MKRVILSVLLVLLASSSKLSAQSSSGASEMPYAGAPCTGEGGVKPSPQQVAFFTRFDNELRSALRQNNAAALAFLVSFPLRVNTARGTILIPDATSLQGHFQEIFTGAVRKDILSTQPGDYICRYDQGVSYAHGTAWISNEEYYTHNKDGRFSVYTINVSDDNALRPTLTYTCRAARHRIVIDELPHDAFRYRSWDGDKSLLGPADIELTGGEQTFEGTGICSFPVYTFTKGNATYRLEGAMGCGDGSEPKNATGSLTVIIGGTQVTRAWCY